MKRVILTGVSITPAAVWRRQPKWVVSRTLTSVGPNATLVQGDYTISIGVANGGFGEGLFKKQLVYAHEVGHFKILRNLQGIMWSGIVNLQPSVYVYRSADIPDTGKALL